MLRRSSFRSLRLCAHNENRQKRSATSTRPCAAAIRPEHFSGSTGGDLFGSSFRRHVDSSLHFRPKKTLSHSFDKVFPGEDIHSESHLRPFFRCACASSPESWSQGQEAPPRGSKSREERLAGFVAELDSGKKSLFQAGQHEL